ncbi:MAG: hypothetical protein E4G94_00055 [ANME-2 cluster archaeon]|nr:MAG: hypothetical protein E4G94_00055 [ANME-2 cluster archaeon]
MEIKWENTDGIISKIRQQLKTATLLAVFLLFIALAITNQTELSTESNIAADFSVELSDTPVTLSNIDSTIHAEKLKEKPISVRTPHFEPLQYLNIHNNNVNNSSVTIRILNEWNRSDLTIYHYAGDDWLPLETRINGSYLEAVTSSFSVFAVGANAEDILDSGAVSHFISYNNLRNSIVSFFHIFGLTTSMDLVNMSNESYLNNTTQNTTHSQNGSNSSFNTSDLNNTTNNTTFPFTPNTVIIAQGIVVDHNGAPLDCEITIHSSNGAVNKNKVNAAQYDSEVEKNDILTLDARKSKDLVVKFKLQSDSSNGNIVLDNFGKNKPKNVKDPDFFAMKYVEIHAENVSYDTVEITVIYKDEELAGFEENKLVLYHYTNGNWISLPTIVDPITNTLTAYVNSFSVFAVGAQGGININLLADDLTFLNNTATIAGAVYYNNSTAAAGIFIEINPAWGGYANTTTDAQGNFLKILSGPEQPGNYIVWVNATSGSLNGSTDISINATNATLYRINTSANIANTTGSSTNTNISFAFPMDAVPESANLILNLSSITNTEVKVNNITIYNGTTDNANLNLIGYFDTQNDINITTVTSVTHTYDISFNFHTTKTATITQPSYYSAALSAVNDMSYDWNNSNVTFHLPDGAYDVTVWENTTDLTSDTSIPARGGLLRIKDEGIETIYNNSLRNFYVNYSLEQVTVNVSIDKQVAEKGETVYVTPYVYYNGSQVDTNTNIKIYRDGGLVYNTNVNSGTPFAYSNATVGVYNISATASPNIDGVVRTGTNHSNLHIKDLLIYLIVDPTHSGKPINVTGRAYYTDCTATCDQTVNLSMDGGSWSTTTNATGHFNYSLPGKTAGSYVITANLTTGNYSASTNATVNVLDNYFYVIKGDLPTVSGEETLSPGATIWVNHPNITRASLYLLAKTSKNLTYRPSSPFPINTRIGESQYSYLSGTFNVPLYPYDYIVIQSAFLNTTASQPLGPLAFELIFELTIDEFRINNLKTLVGGTTNDQTFSDDLKSHSCCAGNFGILKPGNVQTIRVTKISDNTKTFRFKEEINVEYIGYVAEPRDLYFKVNNNFTFAKMGAIPNATVDITGFKAASNSINIINDRTSIIGYNLNLQKRYFGYTTHSETKLTSRINVNDTAVFTPEVDLDLTSATVLIPLMEHAKDVKVFVDDTNVTDSAVVGVNMELPLSEINATKVINVTYWVPILDINPVVNNTQFNRGDSVQISTNITFNSEEVSGATVYANITNETGGPVINLTLTNVYGGMYSANYTLSSSADLGVYDVKVWAYNASTVITSNNTTFKVRGLNVSLNAGGPYVVDNNAIITGYIRDLENNSVISGATVNITISNSSGMVNQSEVTSAANGSYSYTRAVDLAGDYNVSVNATDLNSITGTANDSYEVKYDVSLTTNRTSCNSGDYIEVNVSVHDKSSVDVSTATVTVLIDIPGFGIETMSTGNGRLVYSAGNYSGTFTNTTNLGLYNMTVTATTAIASGDDTSSVRVSTLSVTEILDKTVYIAEDTVYVWGSVYDNEAGVNASGASYNVSIWRGAQYINSNTSSTNSTGGYSVSFPGLSAGSYTANVDVTYDEDNLIGSNTTSFGIRYNVTTTLPSPIYNVGQTVDINISVFDTGVVPVSDGNLTVTITNSTAGLVTTLSGLNITNQSNGYYNTTFVPTYEDDFNISVHVENGVLTGEAPQVTFRVTTFLVDVGCDKPVYKAGDAVNLTGSLWDSEGSSRWGNVTLRVFDPTNAEVLNITLTNQYNNYANIFNLNSTALSGNYTVWVNASEIESAGSLTASNSTYFNIRYEVTTGIPKSLYRIEEEVPINVSVLGTTVPVVDANLTINITNSTGLVKSINMTNITGNSGYYTTTFTPLWDDDFNISVHAENGSVFGDAAIVSFRSTGFYVSIDVEQTIYEANDKVNISGSLWDSQLSPRSANVTIKLIDPEGNETENITLNNKSGTYLHNFTLNSTALSGNYTVQVNASEIASGGSLTASNTSSFDVKYITAVSTNRSEYNTDDSVNVTVNVKNGTSQVDGASVDINITGPNSTLIWSGSANGIGGGNYSANFNLSSADLGIYHVEANVSSWYGYATSNFTVRELAMITSNLYGPYNFNGSHNGPLVPLIVSGNVNDSELNTYINSGQVNISVTYPNNSLAVSQIVTTDASGIYIYNFTSNFSSTSPAGLYNVSIQVNDSGITNSTTKNFTIYTVGQSWANPASDFRMPLMLNNTNSPSSQTYSDKGFIFNFPGGVSQSSVTIKDITGADVGYSAVWDNANTLNVTLDAFSLDIYEGRLIYVYFDRDNDNAPDSGSVGQTSVPLVEGTVEGYWIDITKDNTLYTPPVTAIFTANLTLTDSSPLNDALINFTIYDPNGTLVYGPQNNITDPSNISQTGNSAVLNYSIPAVKGLYGITVNATSQNGIPRTESSTFNVGGLIVGVKTDKPLYNTRENVLFTINVTDSGTPINGATVKIYVNDESGVLPYEFQDESITTNSSGIAETIWNIPTDSTLGNYSITVNVNTTDDTGYNGSQTFRIDRYDLGLTTNTEIIGFNKPLVIRGNTTHNCTNVDSYANVSVIYQNGFIDDVIPYGSIISGGWNWDYNFKHSGMRSHYQVAASSGTGANQHNFYDAYSGYLVGTNENISVWVYIDPLSEPVDEIMIEFYTTGSWGHRAYWGADLIQWGTNNTVSRRSKGALPPTGQWVQLNVSSSEVGLNGEVVEGISFNLNENSSNTAKVWFDDVHFSGGTLYDSYLENQNVTSPGGSYVVNLNSSYVVGEYLVISNSSYSGLSRSNVTGVMVANMNVTANAGGPYSPSIGSVTIS